MRRAIWGRDLGHTDTVFWPVFQKGRVPSEKGTFRAVSGPSKGHNLRGELKKKDIISAVYAMSCTHYGSEHSSAEVHGAAVT